MLKQSNLYKELRANVIIQVTMTVGIQRCHNPGWMQFVARRNVLDQYTANAENINTPKNSNLFAMPSSRSQWPSVRNGRNFQHKAP